MTALKDKLISKLNSITDVSIDRYKDTELLGVNYKGKEVAHFQTGSDSELDLRLSPAVSPPRKTRLPALQ